MRKFSSRFLQDRSGSISFEYLMLIGLVTLVVLPKIMSIGSTFSSLYLGIATKVLAPLQ